MKTTSARRAIKVDLRANFFPVKLQGELCIDATFAALGTFQTQSLHQNISPHPERYLNFRMSPFDNFLFENYSFGVGVNL